MPSRLVLVMVALVACGYYGTAQPGAGADSEKYLGLSWEFGSPRARDARIQYLRALRVAKEQYIKELDGALREVTEKRQVEEMGRIRHALAALRHRAPPDAVDFGSHFYKLYRDPVTWHVAKQRCEELGGYLVCVGSAREDAFVRNLAKGNSIWLGASDEAREGQWRWVSGEPFRYMAWGPNGPDNHLGVQHHLSYWAQKHWDDDFAGARMMFVCEWDK